MNLLFIFFSALINFIFNRLLKYCWSLKLQWQNRSWLIKWIEWLQLTYIYFIGFFEYAPLFLGRLTAPGCGILKWGRYHPVIRGYGPLLIVILYQYWCNFSLYLDCDSSLNLQIVRAQYIIQLLAALSWYTQVVEMWLDVAVVKKGTYIYLSSVLHWSSHEAFLALLKGSCFFLVCSLLFLKVNRAFEVYESLIIDLPGTDRLHSGHERLHLGVCVDEQLDHLVIICIRWIVDCGLRSVRRWYAISHYNLI